jgi:hypothetical protein
MPDPNDEQLLARLTAALRRIPGVCALAPGGSRSRGAATADSDYDIGLYFHPAEPVDTGALQTVVATLDDRRTAAGVTAIGGWGP